jgi:hypothetical protein
MPKKPGMVRSNDCATIRNALQRVFAALPRMIFIKDGQSLVPGEQRAADALLKVKNKAAVSVSFGRPKSPRMIRLYFAAVNKIYQALPERFDNVYPSQDAFRKSIEIEAGLCDPIHSIDGELIGYAPRSLAKANQDEFNDIFENVFRVISSKILPEINSPELESEINEMLG